MTCFKAQGCCSRIQLSKRDGTALHGTARARHGTKWHGKLTVPYLVVPPCRSPGTSTTRLTLCRAVPRSTVVPVPALALQCQTVKTPLSTLNFKHFQVSNIQKQETDKKLNWESNSDTNQTQTVNKRSILLGVCAMAASLKISLGKTHPCEKSQRGKKSTSKLQLNSSLHHRSILKVLESKS